MVRLSADKTRVNSGNLNGGRPEGIWLEALNGLRPWNRQVAYTVPARTTATAFLATTEFKSFDRFCYKCVWDRQTYRQTDIAVVAGYSKMSHILTGACNPLPGNQGATAPPYLLSPLPTFVFPPLLSPSPFSSPASLKPARRSPGALWALFTRPS